MNVVEFVCAERFVLTEVEAKGVSAVEATGTTTSIGTEAEELAEHCVGVEIWKQNLMRP